MRRVWIDELDGEAVAITMEGGAQWGHAYNAIAKARLDGYIVSGGRCPTVDVSGFVMGGGIGPFTRSIGMECVTLLEAVIVTADGEMVTVKRSDDPQSEEGELFWALCGAGGGNFGVVVALRMEIRKLAKERVTAGRFEWYPKSTDLVDILRTMDRFYSSEWSTQMTIDSTWLVNLRRQPADLGIRFTLSMLGHAAFINFPDGTYSPDYERRTLHWDPDNYFSWPQGVQQPPRIAQEEDEERDLEEDSDAETDEGAEANANLDEDGREWEGFVFPFSNDEFRTPKDLEGLQWLINKDMMTKR